MHVGEAEVAALGAVGELGVVEAEEMKDGGVEVVDVDLVLHGIEAELVGFAEFHTGFDAAAVRLTGNVVGQAPFTGTLGHRGWRVTGSRLPQLALGHSAAVLAQAEVEL